MKSNKCALKLIVRSITYTMWSQDVTRAILGIPLVETVYFMTTTHQDRFKIIFSNDNDVIFRKITDAIKAIGFFVYKTLNIEMEHREGNNNTNHQKKLSMKELHLSQAAKTRYHSNKILLPLIFIVSIKTITMILWVSLKYFHKFLTAIIVFHWCNKTVCITWFLLV